MVLVRFSKQFEVCREEQVECTNNRADKFFVHFEDDIEIPLAILRYSIRFKYFKIRLFDSY
jgi:hypothetical protein